MGRTTVVLLVAGLTLAACSTESNLTERFLLQITSEAPGPGAPTEVESLAGGRLQVRYRTTAEDVPTKLELGTTESKLGPDRDPCWRVPDPPRLGVRLAGSPLRGRPG